LSVIVEDWIRKHAARAEYGEIVPLRDASKLDDLVHPLSDIASDDIISWLQPVVATCQLLQIATTTFPDGNSATLSTPQQPVDAFLETVNSFGEGTQRRRHRLHVDPYADLGALDNATNILQKPDSTARILTYPQLYCILIQNYLYEKDEPKLNLAIEAHLIQQVDALRSRLDGLCDSTRQTPARQRASSASSSITCDAAIEIKAAHTDEASLAQCLHWE
jgi:hypothetical protein